VGLGQVWTGSENLVSAGIRSPDRPVHSESLHRLFFTAILLAVRSRKLLDFVLLVRQYAFYFSPVVNSVIKEDETGNVRSTYGR
jgi:hypothetical protein